jgi:hypothetical protein
MAATKLKTAATDFKMAAGYGTDFKTAATTLKTAATNFKMAANN